MDNQQDINQLHRSNSSSQYNQSNDSPTDLIRRCLQAHLDNETNAKFQQVLEYLSSDLYDPLYLQYNNELLKQFSVFPSFATKFPEGYSLNDHIILKIKFYTFKFICNVGVFVLDKLEKGDEKAEEVFVTIIKILLYHGLTAKTFTASLALVELEQLCKKRKTSPKELYTRYTAKFLRVIIKAILHKISNSTNKNGSNIVKDNGSSSVDGSRPSWSSKSTNVIVLIKRALEVFDINSITTEDISQCFIIITNLIHKEKYDSAIKLFLEDLASYQNIDAETLLRNHIQAITISLLLRRKLSHFDMTDSLTKLCSFSNSTPNDVLSNKFSMIKGRLLLNYLTDPKSVTEAIYYLSKFEKEEHERPFEDEFEEEKHFIEYLMPSMIGILLGVDHHFNSRSDFGSEKSILQVRSLHKLISILDENQVKTIHVKLLSTLSLLTNLRQTRNNHGLNTAIKDIWASFVAKLNVDLRSALLINICTALIDLLVDCPGEVAAIYKDLLLKDQSPDMLKSYKTLFFIPDLPAISEVYDFLTSHVERKNTVSTMEELETALDQVWPLCKIESQRCQLIALDKIRQLLQDNQQIILSNMLVNQDEPLNHFISKTIESLLSLSSTQDPECSARVAECLGILGAVNPIRLDHLIYGGATERTRSNLPDLSNPQFIVDLIENLKRSLFSDQRSESEIANYAIQVVIETYRVFENPAILENLSCEALKACNICKNTNYNAISKIPMDLSLSVYEQFKRDYNYSYKDWLDKLSTHLSMVIEDIRVSKVIHACSYLFRYNIKFAEYFLSHIIIHIIVNQPGQVEVIKKELMALLDEEIGVSSQDLDTIYNEDLRGSLQTLHFQCSNLMFCALDAIYSVYFDTRGVKPTLKLKADKLKSIKRFLAEVPKERVAILAARCRAHARALRYFEMFLFHKKDHLDIYATLLQKIYGALDDPYEAAGVEMVRKTPTTITDDIVNYEACGRFDKAFTCCATSLASLVSTADGEPLVEDCLRCLSNQGDHQRLYEKTKQLFCDYSEHKRSILPYAIEACWKLGKWDELDSIFKKEPTESLLEVSSVSQGSLLNCFNGNKASIVDRLKIVRHKLMKPLSIAMLDRSAYFRGYQNLLALHSIGDFALAMNLLGASEKESEQLDENSIDPMRKQLTSLFGIWAKRNKLVQPSLQSLEPLLVWQRSICLVISRKYPVLRDNINIEVGKMWLTSADFTREARKFDRAFYCLIQAQRWFGTEFERLGLDLRVKFYIEKAKLDWEQGEQTRAIRGLKLSLERMKDHRLYNHLKLRQAQIQSKNGDPFPQLEKMENCSECDALSTTDRESFSQLKTLLTHYCEDAAAEIPETLFFMYEECVHLGVNQEETYFRLARYYDRLLAYYMENPQLCVEPADEKSSLESTQKFSQNLVSGHKEDVYTKLMEHSIIAFGNSLKYGVRYLRESMPRLLNIWYDLGARNCKTPLPCARDVSMDDRTPRKATARTPTSRGNVFRGSTPLQENNLKEPRTVGNRVENVNRFIERLMESLPPYYFMTALSLILSRVSHKHSGVQRKTCDILESLLMSYPHQITWQMIALMNDKANDERRNAAKVIMRNCIAKDSKKKNASQHIDRIITDTIDFSKSITELSSFNTSYDKAGQKRKLPAYVELKEIVPKFLRYDLNKLRIIAPIESTIRAILPIDNACGNLMKHNVFPQHERFFIRGIQPQAKVFNSLQQPKTLGLLLENGRSVDLLCKYGDDLRKDSRCVEFLNLLNRILRKDRESNARYFEIQTFLVLPLDSEAGIIEIVPNCESVRNIIEPIYREFKSPNFTLQELPPKNIKDVKDPQILHEYFMKQLLPKYRPTQLPNWFMRTFTEPTSWYMARLAFIRTNAVISMGGYIIGLGDRHLDNMLLNKCNGRLVHVDFNLLFHQGETLPVPERVPFRLTQNFISAMGAMGTEGNFRRACEITMRVMRKEKDALLTTLKPFMHDPCSEWIKVRQRGYVKSDLEDKHAENRSAKIRIEVTERKLKGFPRFNFKPMTLIDSYSIEAQVDSLISEASDPYNLCQMYYGWCPQV